MEDRSTPPRDGALALWLALKLYMPGTRTFTRLDSYHARHTRLEKAAISHNFRIAMVRKKLVSTSKYKFCELGHGSIGIVGQWLIVKLG